MKLLSSLIFYAVFCIFKLESIAFQSVPFWIRLPCLVSSTGKFGASQTSFRSGMPCTCSICENGVLAHSLELNLVRAAIFLCHVCNRSNGWAVSGSWRTERSSNMGGRNPKYPGGKILTRCPKRAKSGAVGSSPKRKSPLFDNKIVSKIFMVFWNPSVGFSSSNP